MSLKVTHYDDPVTFFDHAGDFLLTHEAEHNLMVGLAVELAKGTRYGEAPPYMLVVESEQGVQGAALRTPPYNLILSLMDDAAVLDAVLQHARDFFGTLTGVVGVKELAAQFIEKWQVTVGQTAKPGFSMRIYRLDAVTPPEGVSGTLRRATEADRELVMDWMTGFYRDTGHKGDARRNGENDAERYLTADPDARALYFLEIDGEIVSMAGCAGPTPGSMRVGAVYTPPEQRKRGYGSAVTAAVSQKLLDEGKQFCTLFTDLSNPTTNHIYQEVGYYPVCDVDEYHFDALEQ